ncbi:carbohydrate kinase family protein [Sciscionella marina]|uniref:carbohydrate kinase family protein n=1 Tax=Sciscionella marina TaxID=508770 RepID=UPI000372B856|nr:sugar kinase [Sciscionella marina]
MRTDVVTLGLHILDILGRPVTRIPPGQEVELIEQITMTVAGTAAATAVDLARLGVRTASVGAIGRDALGAFLRERMTMEGVDCTGLSEVDTAQTSATILPIRPDGGRPPLHVIGASAALTEDRIPWSLLAEARVLHFGGSGLLPALDGEPSVRILQRAKEIGLTVLMDFIPTKDPQFPGQLAACLPYVDYLLPNLEDACFVAGTDDRASAIDWCHRRGVGATVLTMGADGVSIAERGGAERLLPAYAVDVVDTTGCGDAFSAGFITALLDGADLEQAAELGLAAGSLVATGLGSDAGITDRFGLDQFATTTTRKQTGA